MLPMSEFPKKQNDLFRLEVAEDHLLRRYFSYKNLLDKNNSEYAQHIKERHANGGKIVLPKTCHRCNNYLGIIATCEIRLVEIKRKLLELGIDASQLHPTNTTQR